NIVGLGKACAIAMQEMSEESKRLAYLRDRLKKKLEDNLDEIHINGSMEHRLPGNLNMSFVYVEGESLLMGINDIAVSSGSACTSATLEPSYVLKALGLGDDLAHSSIRFGIGHFNTEAEADYDHYNNPRNVGTLDKGSNDVGTGLVGAPECGDVMRLQIKVNPETQVIEDAKFKTFGCGSAIASSSLATEWIKGRKVDDALAIKNTDIVKELALPPVKIHCSVLAEDAIRAAIGDWKKKQSASQPASVT